MEAKNRLRITDPVAKRKFKGRDEGRYRIDSPLLTLSLTEIWKKYSFKIVASILTV